MTTILVDKRSLLFGPGRLAAPGALGTSRVTILAGRATYEVGG